MENYLATGVIQNITIDKKKFAGRQIVDLDVTLDEIIQPLSNDINLNCYIFSEDEDRYYWKIKPEILEGKFEVL